ncbi:hypothetical protein MPTK1_1g28930 [Marchantia polymorpha subsp. ruderalis]|uniref:Lectin n=2 Tax=Marchantia polymorpha TaxID=3197 RepID=A0AAF6AVD7_MARPO|nr:hypothetical protein MARPO_0107s0009 [Marchantia polymorpha]BBN00408.1 hypothetical protein Mp_1g28930 [Marchantia polymorpha subsp. ruderalis]|eukprot:PTQ31733.1 hypothetical protein MARPO_0107s0009 [Marchantia polymorpha]
MSYTIRVRVIQTKPSVWYSIVEKTNWSGSTWSDVDGEQFLIMETSGKSGMLRLKNHAGDVFIVALGVHNYKRWCDIVVNQKSNQTSVDILPTYYSSGPETRCCGSSWRASRIAPPRAGSSG